MLRQLRQALHPALPLKECIENWRDISFMLRESSRSRELQMEKLGHKWHFLS
jgi:hypothetical protein